ncbi:hypothetical protein OC835_001095 [Tilletia horrida]|nr:hypothetical protein OC835_001095 [Tilletia horrida]
MPKGARGGRARKQVHAERTTRSSKAKNLQYGLEDPEQAEKQLTAQLKAMGLYAANTLGDGNCLFRALSDQLYGYPNQHLHIRHAICDYLQAHPEKYAGFVDDAKPFDAYVRNMREQGTYGGHLELSAFAQLKRKQIKIVQPKLVYVVAADDESESPADTGASEGTGASGSAEASLEPPPTTRQLRRMKREAKHAQPSPSMSGTGASGSEGSTASASVSPLDSTAVASSSTSALQAFDSSSTSANTHPLSAPAQTAKSSIIPASPLTSSSKHLPQASPSTTRQLQSSPSKPISSVRTSLAAAPLVEATGPLYIAYHNWEHYSSIRNLDGPHSGLPKIRERPINQADLANELSTIAAKAVKRGGLPPGKGKAKANTRPGTSSLDSEQPTEEEKLVMESAPGHSLFEVRQLLKLLGSWEDVVEKLVAEDGADGDGGAGGAAKPRPPNSVAEDAIVITSDEDVELPSIGAAAAASGSAAPPVVNQAQAIRNAVAHASTGSCIAHPQIPVDNVWRAGSPSSVGTAASGRSSASMLTAGTSTSTSTVPTSDDWNAGDSTSSGIRTPAAAELGGRGRGLKDGDDEYLALSPDSTLTAREMSVLEDGRPGPASNEVEHEAACVPSSSGGGRISPSAFKRKANHGYDVGADGDDDSEMSHKRFSPARAQYGEGEGQALPGSGLAQRVVPSSVSPSSGEGSHSSQGTEGEQSVRSTGTAVPPAVGRVAKSGLTRVDAISVGSGSSSDSDVPIGLLRGPITSSQSSMGDSPRVRLVPPSQQVGRRHQRAQTSSGGSTDDDSIASSRPRRTSATPVDYRASALGRTGTPGPGQTPVSVAASAPAPSISTSTSTSTSPAPAPAPAPAMNSIQSKRAKRDQKRAEKVERERAKARARRMGRVLDDEDEDEDEEDGEEGAGGAAAGGVPAQFAFRELRI